MKAFVTGGTGFIGVPFVRALLARGDQVVLGVRDAGKAKRLFPEELSKAQSSLSIETCDLLDAKSIQAAMKGCEAVFHLAGTISYRRKEQAALFRVNRDATAAVADAALALGAGRMVHVSSIVAVGIQWGPSRPLNEDDVYNGHELKLSYFDSKHEAEGEIRKRVALGLDAVIVNPSTVVGRKKESGPAGNVKRAIRALARAPFLLPGGNSWVDVKDVVKGILLAHEKGRPGRRYILTSQNISNAEITRRLYRESGLEPPRVKLSGRALKFLGRFVPSASRVCGFFLYADSTRARVELGWVPSSAWGSIIEMGLSS